MGEVRHDTKIMGDIYRILWKRDVNTYAGCEEAAAALALYLENEGIEAKHLWDERPNPLELQKVIHPFKTTKMELIDDGLIRIAEGMLRHAHRGTERSAYMVSTSRRIAKRAWDIFEDNRYVIVALLVNALPVGGYIKPHHVRMTFGAEIANAVDAFARTDSQTLKQHMDKVVGNDIASGVKALYLADDLDEHSALFGSGIEVGDRLLDDWMYQIGRLREEFSIEIDALISEGFDDGDAT